MEQSEKNTPLIDEINSKDDETLNANEVSNEDTKENNKKKRFGLKKIKLKTKGNKVINILNGKNKKKIIAIIVAAALILVFIVPNLLPETNVSDGDEYTLSTAEYRDLSISVSATGTVEPADSYTVMGFVKGEILQAPFEEGDIIEKDSLLYQIDTSDVERNVTQSSLSLSSAQRSYENALKNMDSLNIKASEAGKVSKINVKEGDSVQAGTVVAEILDSETMTLEVSFLSSDADAFYIGQPATATISSSGETLYGEVTWISGATTVGTGGALIKKVELSLSNPGGANTDMYATAMVGGIACNDGGTLEYNAEVSVTSDISGDVESVLVKEGDWVYEDQVLVTIESDTYEEQLENARNSLTSSELSYESTLDSMDEYTIKSPISGTVIEKNFKEGDTIDSTSDASSMAVIYDMSYMTIDLNIDELDIGSIEVGQKVIVTSDAFSQVFEGVVETKNIKGTSSGGVTTYPVTVRLDEYGELLPGMNVTAEIMIEEASGVLAVPTGAVSRGNTVLVQKEGAVSTDEDTPDGFERVTVELGRTDGNYIEIVSGLSEGDVVAVYGDSTNSSMFMGSGMGGMSGMSGMNGGGAPSGAAPGGGAPSGAAPGGGIG